jgi:4-hydroxybenzoate polyprenyltransferase
MVDPLLEKALEAARAADPAAPWRLLFMTGCYAMAAGCLYRGIREGARDRSFRVGLVQCVLFAFLVGMFWFLESWAHHRTPFYVYSTAFTDLVPRLALEGVVDRGVTNACTTMVLGVQEALRADRIPLSILLMEASLAYAALWTARNMGASLVVQPFLAALVFVNVDALLDPVLATSHRCTDGAAMQGPGIGLGFWRWYVDREQLADWYGIPIFNYAAWFTAPLFLVALVNLCGHYGKRLVPRSVLQWLRVPGYAPLGWRGLALLTMAGGIVFLFSIAPNHAPGVGGQNAMMAGAVAVALIAVLASPSRWKTDRSPEVALILPAAIAIAIPALAFLYEGFFVKVPRLLLVGIASVAFGLLFSLFGCRRTVRSWCRRLGFLDRLIRLHYFGFTAMLVLLGAGLLERKPETRTVAGLLLVALCFHLWSYVLNDVVDLELDKKQPRRRGDPLVSGAVSREAALAFALVQVPLAAVVALHLVGFAPRTSPWALPVLGAGFLLILVYNLWGRVSPIPPLTDLAQGLGWASLVVFGALVASPDPDELWRRTFALIVYAVGYILLVSGVGGGLRDLAADEAYGRRTTALWFGARPSSAPGGEPVESSRALAVYAFAIHTVMFAAVAVFLVLAQRRPRPFYAPDVQASAWVLWSVFFVANNVILWRVVRRHGPRRDQWFSTQLFLLLLPPVLLYQISLVPDPVFKVVVLACFFVPLALQEEALGRLLRFLYRSARPLIPNGCGPAGVPVPDEMGGVDWKHCCDLHDVAYWEGGIRGGLLPWWGKGRFEWRYLRSNLGLASCMRRRWSARLSATSSPRRRAWLAFGRAAVPALYFLATMLLGWFAWSWNRRELGSADLRKLAALTPAELASLEASL